MEIYVDVVFAVNFFADLIILWAAGKLARLKAHLARMCLGSFLMSLMYCVLIVLAPPDICINICASVVILSLGTLAAFGLRTLKSFVAGVSCAYASAFALGGIGMALYYAINTSAAGRFPLYMLLASSAVFYAAFKIAMRWYGRFAVKKQAFYPVKIFYGEMDVALTALLDTGNTLKDPVSNAPVIVAEFGAVKGFLPDRVKLLYYENNEDNLPLVLENISGTSFSGRFRMIPFASLGARHGLLLGFRPDRVEIENGGDVVTLKDVIVGIYNCPLAGDGSYQGLLHPEMIR